MRVLYIADELTQSGAIKSFEEVVCTMKNIYGIDVIVCTSGRSELNNRLESCGIKTVVSCYASAMQNSPITWWKIPVKYIWCGIKYFLKRDQAIKKIEEQLDFSQIDLIHTNVNRTDIGVELANRHNIPNVMHIREFGDADFNCWSYRKHYIEYLNQNVTEFIAISNAVKKSWVERGLSSSHVNVIYNGVHSEKIKAVVPEELSAFHVMRMVIVGGVIPAKGQIQAIRAINKLPKEIKKKVSLDIIGWSSKEYFSILESEIRKLGMEDQIKVLGPKSDIYDRLCDYHVGLMCSKAEGFGRVTVEYMHAGLGVIASNCGANPELIENRETGLLYDWGNEEMLADKITEYYYNRKLLKKCAINGKMSAQNKYTDKINAEHIADLYSDIVGEGIQEVRNNG